MTNRIQDDGNNRVMPISVAVLFGGTWLLIANWTVTAIYGTIGLTAQSQLVTGGLFILGATVFISVVVDRRGSYQRSQGNNGQLDRENTRTLRTEDDVSEALLAVILSNITETVILTDDDGRFTYICPNVHYIFGHTVSAVSDMERIDALLEEDPAADGIREGEVIENIEQEITDADGDTHTVLVTVKSVSIQGGTRLYSVRDITELNESKHELAQERERIETVVAHAPLILTALDSEGTITVSKGRQLRELGIEPDEVVGESIFDVFDDVPQFRENAERVLDGETFETEVSINDRIFEAWHQPMTAAGHVDHAIIVAQDITKRKRHQDQFRAFVEASPDIIVMLDREGYITYMSPSSERILGFEPAELIGECVFDLAHPEEQTRLRESFDGLYDSTEERTATEQHRMQHADESWRWTESRAIAGTGMVEDGYVVTIRDVSDRVEATQQLRKTEQSRSLALQASQAGVWEWDIKTDEVIWHESCEELFGLAPGTFNGTYEAFAHLVHPEDLSDVEAALERSIKHNEPFQTTYRIIRADGVERWIDGRGSIFHDEVGEPERMLGVDMDISERKEREQELELYEKIVETTADPIFALDTTGTIILANDGLAAATGRSKGELLEANIRTVLDTDNIDADLGEIDALIHGDDDLGTFEVAFADRPGNQMYEVNISPVDFNEDGGLSGAVWVARDVTDLRDHLQQSQVMTRLLRHNLRNAMTVIRGYAETIHNEASNPLAAHAEQIIQHSDKLIDQSEKQREIAKVLSSEPSFSSTDLLSVLDRTVEELEEAHPEARIEIDSPEDVTVSATTNLGRAIEEVVGNAIIHTDQENPEVEILVTEGQNTGQIEIVDTGPGIPEMDRRVVEGGHKVEPLYHGSGLGLWLVSWIIRRSNGTLSFTENDPRGTIVTIQLLK